MRFRPTASEERLIALASSAKRWARAGIIESEERARVPVTIWRTSSLPMRIGLFLLTLLGFLAASLFTDLILHGFRFVVSILAIAAAEHLIARKQWFRSGVEEGLWIAGAMGLAFEVVRAGTESMLVLAVAAIVAAARLAQPYFALFGIAWAIGWIAAETESSAAAGWSLAALSLIALLAQAREIRRPWIETTLAWMTALGAPIAALMLYGESRGTALAFAAVACSVWLAAGIMKRSRAALIGGALLGLAIGADLFERLPWLVEAKLIVAGAVLFALAASLARWLRVPRRGFTSLAIDREGMGGLAELVSVAMVAPTAPAVETRDSGGAFGGAGGSGEW